MPADSSTASHLPRPASPPTLKRKAPPDAAFGGTFMPSRLRESLVPALAQKFVSLASPAKPPLQENRGAALPPAKRPRTAGLLPTRVGANKTTVAARRAATAASRAPQQPAGAPKQDADWAKALPKPDKKIAKHNYKGRIEDLHRVAEQLTTLLRASRDASERMIAEISDRDARLAELNAIRESLTQTVHAKEAEAKRLHDHYRDAARAQEQLEQRHASQLELLASEHQRETTRLQLDLQDLQRAHTKLTQELETVREDRDTLRRALDSTAANLSTLSVQVRALEGQRDATQSQLAGTEQELRDREMQLAERDARIADLEHQVRAGESERRKLHNTIQELRGNIRVFCRVRPLLPREGSIDLTAHMDIKAKDNALDLLETRESADGTRAVAKTYPFAFDRVFAPATPQHNVFDEIAQLVQSALDGYNVCIFAYGQTGSGKTYTMEGPSDTANKDDDHPDRGMIPRAVDQIFATAESLKPQGWTYTFEGTYLEIYNETLRDLLAVTSDKKLDIKLMPGGRTGVPGATVVSLTSPRAVRDMLRRASQARAVAATNMNERSSRSHSVFTLTIAGHNALTNESCMARINLVDLAGSERLAQSGATGDRLRETQAINKSLSALGDVIVALASDAPHVPYRNSKLTHLLADSLGGNSKTLMFVNVSPLPASFGETLNSLRFATKVNACQIGTAKKQTK